MSSVILGLTWRCGCGRLGAPNDRHHTEGNMTIHPALITPVRDDFAAMLADALAAGIHGGAAQRAISGANSLGASNGNSLD